MANQRKIRLLADRLNLGTANDIITGDSVSFGRGSALSFQVGFAAASIITDLAFVSTAILEVKPMTGGLPPAADVSSVMLKVLSLSSLDVSLVQSTWNDLSKEHGLFEFDSTESNLIEGNYYLIISIQDSSGSIVPYLTSIIEVVQDGSGAIGDPDELKLIQGPQGEQGIQGIQGEQGADGDHGSLAGLADDDHSQYHNDARGDARYGQKSNNLSDLANAPIAFGNIKQVATESATGVIELATAAEVDGATGEQVVRAKHLKIRTDANGAVSIGDLGGNARGDNAINIQAARSAVTKVASGLESVAIGSHTTASATASGSYGYATAVGYDATASGYYGYATAIGYDATASSYSTAVGYSSAATGFASTAIGDLSEASDNFCTAIGYHAKASSTNTSAIGKNVKTTVSNTTEIGYWSGGTTRGGAIRAHSTGMVAMTIQNRATAFGDGGATAGSEADNTVIREGIALRRDGNEILVDLNIAGTITTLSLGTAS